MDTPFLDVLMKGKDEILAIGAETGKSGLSADYADCADFYRLTVENLDYTVDVASVSLKFVSKSA
jgi:hypothetical protein